MTPFVSPAVTADAFEAFFALANGFAVAGACANGYRLLTERFPSFRLLEAGPASARFASVPLLMFAAPFIIMRNTVRGCRIEQRRMHFVMIATVIAGLWSLMSGEVVVLGWQAIEFLIA